MVLGIAPNVDIVLGLVHADVVNVHAVKKEAERKVESAIRDPRFKKSRAAHVAGNWRLPKSGLPWNLEEMNKLSIWQKVGRHVSLRGMRSRYAW